MFFKNLLPQILKILANLTRKNAKMEKFAVRQIHGELRGPLRPYFLNGDPFCPVVPTLGTYFGDKSYSFLTSLRSFKCHAKIQDDSFLLLALISGG
jgi:hypothetical protein